MKGVWIPKSTPWGRTAAEQEHPGGASPERETSLEFPLRFGGHLFQKQMLPELIQTLNQKCTSQKPVAFLQQSKETARKMQNHKMQWQDIRFQPCL